MLPKTLITLALLSSSLFFGLPSYANPEKALNLPSENGKYQIAEDTIQLYQDTQRLTQLKQCLDKLPKDGNASAWKVCRR